MSGFFDLVHHQRAYRTFSDEPVDDATIGRLLDAAVHAPSAENRQPWEFVVVQDPALRSSLLDFAEKAWDGGGREFAEARLTPGLMADVERGIAGGGYRDAPVLIVVAADIERGLKVTVPSSIFPAIQNLLLAATELGLASALTTISMGFTEDLQAMLGLPAHVVPQAVIPIGHPVRPLGPSKRDPFETHTHRDRFGTPW
ncbi:MAG: nitroreductase [Acidimicrobiia bacterium]|nr:nitroreductase [Acidimicrobiia bacterium]